MTQSINFDDLRTAFAPETSIAQVASINGHIAASFSPSISDSVREKESKMDSTHTNKEFQDLLDTASANTDKLDAVEAMHQKSLRFIESLTLDKEQIDKMYVKVHEDKIRLIRVLQNKTTEIESLKAEVFKGDTAEKKLTTILHHAKKDVLKVEKKKAELVAEIKSLKNLVKAMTQEVVELKEQNTLFYKIKENISDKFETGKTQLSTFVDNLKHLKKQPVSELPKIKWIGISTKLPSNQCMVYVRNSELADMAVYYPESQTFKCVHKQINVTEWAHSN